MELAKDTRDRIFAAADSLYYQAGRAAFPTVDAVRKTARANMNDASAGMKEWRRAQTAQAAPVAVQVPEVVQQASSAALAALWREAQELANESLRAAQAGWDAERVEADTINKQMADAYEGQAAELDAAGAALEAEKAAAAQQAQELATVRQQLADASSRADKAEARIAEIEHRAADLRGELDRAHADADHLRTENAEGRKQATAEIEAAHAAADAARGEVVKVQARAEAAELSHIEQHKQAAAEAHRADERMTKAQTERDQARQDAGSARERAAELSGQLTAHQEQTAAILDRLAPADGKSATRKKGGTPAE